MKKFLLFVVIVLVGVGVKGQDNVFPSTGNLQLNKGNLVQAAAYSLTTQGRVKLKDYLLFDSDGDFSGGNYFTIQDDLTSNYLRFGYGFSAQLVLKSNGYFGIGTTEPSTPLDVVGVIKSKHSSNSGKARIGTNTLGGYLDAHNISGEQTALIRSYIDPNGVQAYFTAGKVGVGTTTPSNIFDVNSSGENEGIFVSRNNVTRAKLTHAAGQGGSLELINSAESSTVKINSVGKSYITGGNVGIGTVNPGSPLEIQQINDPNSDKGLVISEPNNSQKIHLHLANNSGGQYGFFSLGGTTFLRGNGQPSTFDGALGIGTSSMGTHKLAVEGTIGAREIKVEATGWSDFVFDKDYKLRSLKEVETYINRNKHLPDVPSEKEVMENGIALGEMDATLLQKIEELTLYVIEQNKQLKEQNKKNKEQQSEIAKLKAENQTLKEMQSAIEDIQKQLEGLKK